LSSCLSLVCVDSEMNLVMDSMASCTFLLNSYLCQCLVLCIHSVTWYLTACWSLL
jgi:hypothetical protein